jgi:glycosyltransferase involved in cell wall biosynthesis
MNTLTSTGLRGEIESPRPLHARDGKIEIAGWCLDGDRVPSAVRLACEAGEIHATEFHARADLGGARCGFTLRGSLPAGIYFARFEARGADGIWRVFRSYSLSVEAPPLAAAIEWPLTEGTVAERVRLAGWAAHPQHEIASLSLRFGHRDVPCDYGQDRTDVAALLPHFPHASKSGFITTEMLPAGHGPLRVRAKLANGDLALAPTRVTISVRADENIDAALDLSAPRVDLPGYAPPRPAEPATPAATPRNILFLLPGSFASNNALHAAGLANELAAAGHRCAIAVAHDLATIAHHAAPAFAAIDHDAALAYRFSDGRGPDVVHAWTTRESVRRLAEQLHHAHGCQLVVHLEDNEQQVLSLTLGRAFTELDALSDAELDALVPADLSHPHRSREFLASADGITLIAPKLCELAPVAARCLTLWPAADARYYYPRPLPVEFRRLLDVAPNTTVLFYPGNVHAANAAEVRELYAAVTRLNESGTPVTLIRTGLDTVDFLGAHAGRAREHVLELGQILHHRHLAPLMALADIFVQPGVADAFNDYRFPSKLPEFFALGRPVILPRTNLGEKVRHGEDAYVLERADATGIAHAVRELRANPALAARLATGAARFAAEHFSWRRSAEALAKFYASLATS